MLDGRELREERTRRELAHLLPGCPAHGVIGRDDAHELGAAVLGRETLEEIVGVRSEPHGERPDRALLPHAVEDDDAASAPTGDEARERVHQLVAIRERPRVEQVVAVEQVEGRLSHRRALRWRRASKSSTAAATETFSEPTLPASGIETVASHVRRTSGRTPFPSAPKTSATPPVRSASHIGTVPSAVGGVRPQLVRP